MGRGLLNGVKRSCTFGPWKLGGVGNIQSARRSAGDRRAMPSHPTPRSSQTTHARAWKSSAVVTAATAITLLACGRCPTGPLVAIVVSYRSPNPPQSTLV